jgi:ribosomal protein L7/L12
MNLDKLEKQVRALIDQDQKIEAIKLVRRITGWGLKESKDYVDALARAALPALSPAGEAALEQEVKALAQQDRYMEAIKHVRERTGWNLGDCKAHVDMLTKGSTINWTFVASRASDLLDQGMKDKAVEWVTAQAKLDSQEAQDYVDFVLMAK